MGEALGRRSLEAAPESRLFAPLSRALLAEGDRRLLWLPVAFGAGIGLYFWLKFEPPLWPGLILAAVAIAAFAALPGQAIAREAALALALFAAGFALMRFVASETAAPSLHRRQGPVVLSGLLTDIARKGKGWRIVLAPDPSPAFAKGEEPSRIRLYIPARGKRLEPGERVRVKAMLFPVPGPALPGGYDFERAAYFARIGAVGFSYGTAHRIAGAAASPPRLFLRRLRNRLTRRIHRVLPGAAGGVASALITGERGAIPLDVVKAFRDSGLSHLLSIAGLHLGLVGAFVFFVLRAFLALIPAIALRYPIKKIAAGAALLVLFGYLLISGARVPTERAFIMDGVVFGAILLDRLRISMRICALAAFLVLALSPQSLVGVSFEMSFGAVVALIAVYETYGARLTSLWRGEKLSRRLFSYGLGVVVTTLLATAGTEPFAAYDFHRLILYSPLGNILAVPLSALWTLPWGLVSSLLMPFGLEAWGLIPMGWGIDATIRIAEFASALPGDVWPLPRLPLWGLLLIVFGGLWLALWRERWRLWGSPAIAVGVLSMFLTSPPDIVMADGGRFLAARAGAGFYFVDAGRGEKFERSYLTEATGSALKAWPKGKKGRLDCSGSLCSYRAHGKRVAIVLGKEALPLPCARFAAVVARVPAGFRCRKRIPVIDRIDNGRQGSVALWLGGRGIAIESANGMRGSRPWVPEPLPKAAGARPQASGRN